MRLVCPNCTAQYEVDASLLPDEGTEVQCSACSTVWFPAGSSKGWHNAAPCAKAGSRAAPVAPSAGRPASRAFAAPPRGPGPMPRQATALRSRPKPLRSPIPLRQSLPTRPPRRARLTRLSQKCCAKKPNSKPRSARKKHPRWKCRKNLGFSGLSRALHIRAAGASRLPDIDDISSTLEPIDSGRGGAVWPAADAIGPQAQLSWRADPAYWAGMYHVRALLGCPYAGAISARPRCPARQLCRACRQGAAGCGQPDRRCAVIGLADTTAP